MHSDRPQETLTIAITETMIIMILSTYSIFVWDDTGATAVIYMQYPPNTSTSSADRKILHRSVTNIANLRVFTRSVLLRLWVAPCDGEQMHTQRAISVPWARIQVSNIQPSFLPVSFRDQVHGRAHKHLLLFVAKCSQGVDLSACVSYNVKWFDGWVSEGVSMIHEQWLDNLFIVWPSFITREWLPASVYYASRPEAA